jgi:hypothetical protein
MKMNQLGMGGCSIMGTAAIKSLLLKLENQDQT